MRLGLSIVTVTLSVFLSSLSLAATDTLVLQSGETIHGKILKNQNQNTEILMDVGGLTETYYLGEIATINGKQPQITLPAPAQNNPSKALKVGTIKPFKPLITADHSTPKVKTSSSIPSAPFLLVSKTEILNHDINLVPTADGGVVVLKAQALTKYDKDLNLVKTVDLNPSKTVLSTTQK